MAEVKRLQGGRFRGTYFDLLKTDPYRQAVQFFLDELYGDRDFAQRDLQFARIAGALQRIFPKEVVATAVALAELHALSEKLDFAMAHAWVRMEELPVRTDAMRYVTAWRKVANKDSRTRQLKAVLALGYELEHMTRTTGLRLMLKMMRRPATAAGLGDLQRFLESGFDTFSNMARKRGVSAEFLRTVEEREATWIARLFDGDPVACATELQNTLGQAR